MQGNQQPLSPSARPFRPGWDQPPPEVILQRWGKSRSAGVMQGWKAPTVIFDMPAGFSTSDFKWHRPPGIAVLLGGTHARHAGPGQRRVTGRDVAFWPGGEHRLQAEAAIRFGVIALPGPLFDRASETNGLPSFHGRLRDDLSFVPDAELHRMSMDYLRRAFDQRLVPTAMEMEARSLLLVDYIIRLHGHAPPPPLRGGLAPFQLRRAQEFLHAHLTEDLALSDVAAVVGLSSSHFARAFREATGLPPHRWMIVQRLEMAKALLDHGELPLADVALHCGFADQSHFTNSFRRVLGVTPGQWRRGRLG